VVVVLVNLSVDSFLRLFVYVGLDDFRRHGGIDNFFHVGTFSATMASDLCDSVSCGVHGCWLMMIVMVNYV